MHLPQPFEELDHTADAGVLVHGQSAEQTLARLVLALSAVLTGGGAVSAERDLTVQVERGDRAAMAVDVLRELLFRFECEMVVPESCAVTRFDPEHGCTVEVGVGPYDPEAHVDGLALKAVTLHAARFERDADGWLAQVVFDV